jgi:CheY-like chemotaxis protein
MTDLDRFVQALQDALTHLYDPDYQPSEDLYAALGCDPERGPAPLQSAIIESIKGLEPDPTEPSSSRTRQDYEVLHYRFILKLTQEETAQRMHVSVRSVQREQRRAVYTLSRRLWEQTVPPTTDGRVPPVSPPTREGSEWISQVHEELRSLQKADPDAEANLEATVHGAVHIATTTATQQGITVSAEPIPSDIHVRVHPSALRQVFLTLIAELQQSMASGTITLRAQRDSDHVRLVVTADPARAAGALDLSLAKALLSAQGGEIQLVSEQGRISCTIRLKIAQQPRKEVKVLAVDDNADLIALYDSYCAGTQYQLVHVGEGKRVFDEIQQHEPKVILLDVMLPDVDGWDLLLDLRANPATRSIPIVVCSVITDEELALALGAALYLRKPVWRGQLLDALDHALSLAPKEA